MPVIVSESESGAQNVRERLIFVDLLLFGMGPEIPQNYHDARTTLFTS
jgi:hypothetical protein